MTNRQVGWIVAAIVAVGFAIVLVLVNRPEPTVSSPPYFPMPTYAQPTLAPYTPPAPTTETTCNIAGGAWIEKPTYPYGVCVGY